MENKMLSVKFKMLNTHRGFIDPISLFAVVVLLISLTFAVPQVLKNQNPNEKAAGGCTTNPAQCKAGKEECVNGVCKPIPSTQTTNNTSTNTTTNTGSGDSCGSKTTSATCTGCGAIKADGVSSYSCKWLSASSSCVESANLCNGGAPVGPIASEVVPNSYSSCSPSPTYAWCGGCGGFCIKVGSQSCSEVAQSKCGVVTNYIGPACDLNSNGAIVVNGTNNDSYYVKCNGVSGKWEPAGTSACTTCLSVMAESNVPAYLKADYDKAVIASNVGGTKPVFSLDQPENISLNQAVGNTTGANIFATIVPTPKTTVKPTPLSNVSLNQTINNTVSPTNPFTTSVKTPSPTPKTTIKPTVKPTPIPNISLNQVSGFGNLFTTVVPTPKSTVKPTPLPTGVTLNQAIKASPNSNPFISQTTQNTTNQINTYLDRTPLPTPKQTVVTNTSTVTPPLFNSDNYSCTSSKYLVRQNEFGAFYCEEDPKQIDALKWNIKCKGSVCQKCTKGFFSVCQALASVEAIQSETLKIALATTKANGSTCTTGSECNSGNCASSWVESNGSKTYSTKGNVCTYSQAEQDGFTNASSTRQTEIVSNTMTGLTIASGVNAVSGLAKILNPATTTSTALTIAENVTVQTPIITRVATNAFTTFNQAMTGTLPTSGAVLFNAGTKLAGAVGATTFTAGAVDCAFGVFNGTVCEQGMNMAVTGFASDPVLFTQSIASGLNTIKDLPRDTRLIFSSLKNAGVIQPLTENAGGINIGNTAVNKAVNPATTLNSNNVNVIDDVSGGFQWIKNPVTGAMEPVAISAPVANTIQNTTSNLLPSITNTSIQAQQNAVITNAMLNNFINNPVRNVANIAVPAIVNLTPSLTNLKIPTAVSIAGLSGNSPPVNQVPTSTIPNLQVYNFQTKVFEPASSQFLAPPPITPLQTTTQKVVATVTNAVNKIPDLLTFGKPLPAGTEVVTNQSVTSGVKLVNTNGTKTPTEQKLDTISNQINTAFTNRYPNGANNPSCRVGMCGTSSDFVATGAKLNGLDAKIYQVGDLNIQRGVPAGQTFDHGITIVSDNTGTQYLVDLTFTQFVDKDFGIIMQIDEFKHLVVNTGVNVKNSPLAQELIDKGYIKLDNNTLNQYLRITSKPNTGSAVGMDLLSQVAPKPNPNMTTAQIEKYIPELLDSSLAITPTPPQTGVAKFVNDAKTGLTNLFGGGKTAAIPTVEIPAGITAKELPPALGFIKKTSPLINTPIGKIPAEGTINTDLIFPTSTSVVLRDEPVLLTVYNDKIFAVTGEKQILDNIKSGNPIVDFTFTPFSDLSTRDQAIFPRTNNFETTPFSINTPVYGSPNVNITNTNLYITDTTTDTGLSKIIQNIKENTSSIDDIIAFVSQNYPINHGAEAVRSIFLNSIPTGQSVPLSLAFEKGINMCYENARLCQLVIDVPSAIKVVSNGTQSHAILNILGDRYFDPTIGKVVDTNYYQARGFEIYNGDIDMTELTGLGDNPLTPTPQTGNPESSVPALPKLANPPAGVVIERPLNIEGVTKSSDIYIGKNAKGEEKVFVIARTPENIKDIQAQYDFLTSNYGPKRTIGNLFQKIEQKPMQDFSVTKPVLDYRISGIGGKYEDYTVTTRFVQLDKDSISPQMLASGQIVEERALGESMTINGLNVQGEEINVVNRNLSPEVHAAAIMNYLDFSIELKNQTGKFLDVNIEKDLFVFVDDNLKNIYVTRVDPSPFDLGLGIDGNNNYVSSFISGSITSNYLSSPESADFGRNVLSNRFLGIGTAFKDLPLEKQTLEGLKEFILQKEVAPFIPPSP